MRKEGEIVHTVSKKEIGLLFSEFAYDEEKSGIIGGFCEEGFPLYYANKKMLSMLGYENVDDLMKEISGKAFNVVHPDDRRQVLKDLGNGIEEGSSFQSVYRMRRKDGTWFWTIDSGKVVKIRDGRLVLLSLCSDMTDFMKRQDELEKKTYISESMIKKMPGGYHRCGAEDGYPFLYISAQFEDILGWTREEIHSQFDNKLLNLVHPDDRALVTHYITNLENNKKLHTYKDQVYRMIGRDGYHWVTDAAIQLEIDGKTIYQGVITDISPFMKEREESEGRKNRQLEDERNSAISANEMKSRFLSSISHDIRTPINGIQGMLRIADAYPNDMKKQNECREKMWVATNYLISLVNNVLNMNRLESKSIDLSEQSFNLIDLLMDVTSMADLQTKAEGLHSVVDWKPGYIEHRYLKGSSEGLSRILMNLNSNAVKYNKKGGSVYCRCKELKCDGDTAWFEFVIKDTGIGMSEEFLKHAFDAYEQADARPLSSIHGVGLGLAIVKQTVEQMGGTLQAESELGKGSTFTIMLPFKLDLDPQVKPLNYENVSLKGVRVLLVEDNELNTEIAKFYLEQEDIEVTTAENGLEAVNLFGDSPEGYYDIILMDIMMPVMNGLEATKTIRGLDRADAEAVPIIAMSADAFEKDIRESMEAGLNAYLVKPMDGKKITDTMKRFLANKISKKQNRN